MRSVKRRRKADKKGKLMKEIILIKNGELALKGLNRRNFEDALIKNMKRRLMPLGEVAITRSQSTIYVEPRLRVRKNGWGHTFARSRIS